MPLTASAGQQAPTPIIDGGPQVQTANFSLSSAGVTHTGVSIAGTNTLALTATRFGTLVSETLTLQVSVDGGTNYRDFKTYTFAELNIANGIYRVENVKGTHVRCQLANAQAGSGINLRFFV